MTANYNTAMNIQALQASEHMKLTYKTYTRSLFSCQVCPDQPRRNGSCHAPVAHAPKLYEFNSRLTVGSVSGAGPPPFLRRIGRKVMRSGLEKGKQRLS